MYLKDIKVLEIVSQGVSWLSSMLWGLFLPLITIIGLYIISKLPSYKKKHCSYDKEAWSFQKVKNSLSISISSKVGTGAVIGVLAALWRCSDSGIGGEGVILWVLIAMILLIPLTYSEVLFTQVSHKMSRQFVEENTFLIFGLIYSLALAFLYSFGFVGFQFTGMQTVITLISQKSFHSDFTSLQMLLFVIIPMVIITAVIIITKNHKLFVNVLGSLISIVIVFYILLFIIFVGKTSSFIPTYFHKIIEDFLDFRSAALGLPIGFILGFQRIIQTSETVLGTNTLAGSDRCNSPRREAFLQVISTLLTLFIAIVITSYIYSYGRYTFSDISLTANGVDRVMGYIETLYRVTGLFGLFVILIFFLLSGYCTVLGSYHFVNTTLKISVNKKIALYLFLITSSGLLSLSHFSMIFDIADLLMFLVGTLVIISMANYVRKN